MQFLKFVHPIYVLARKAVTASGLSAPLRLWLGPIAGRTMFKISASSNRSAIVHGHHMILADNGGYPPVAMAMDRYETETTKLFEGLIKPGMVVIDVGGHVGYYSLLAARQVGPAGKVYAFEPEPGNYELLLRNIESNHYSNILAIRKAVSDRVGSTTLFLTALDNGRHSSYHHGLPERGQVPVETTTLDAFLDAAGWPKVDLVKVDVEGAEKDVLDGMDLLLEKSPQLKLIVEFSPVMLQEAGADPIQFLEQLGTRHFEFHRIAEKKGPVKVPKEEWHSLVNKLLKDEQSVNLLCTRA